MFYSPGAKINVRHIKAPLRGDKLLVGILVAEFNEYFTGKLLEGALDTLLRCGVKKRSIDVVHVPGSFEIPFFVKRLLRKRRYDAVITLGVVLKGGTRHHEQVSDAAARGTLEASLESDVPVIHGVVTAETKGQAVERLGGKLGHRGRQAAETAVLAANLARKLG